MNGLILTLGFLMQAPAEGCQAAPPSYLADQNCPAVNSPCYESSGWGCRQVCGSHSCGRCCCCIKPIGDLYPHYQYNAQPKMYYYLRPYNHKHVQEKAAEAIGLGANPQAPYSNALFKQTYEAVEAKFSKSSTN